MNEQHKTVDVFLTFLRLGLTSFGGPIAHIGYFRTEFVEKQKWLTESQFGQLLAISQFLSGPSSSQLGFSIGLIRAGWRGALAAFTAFTLPSVILLICFASSLTYLSGPLSQAAIHGLKIVALAVVAHGLLGMWRNLCPDTPRRLIALLALVILLLAGSTWVQLISILFGALAGVLLCKDSTQEATETGLQLGYSRRIGYGLIGLFFVLLIGFLLTTTTGVNLISVADAFYYAGALVFGGGHVVLPFLEESLVGTGWLNSEQFLAGYGASQAIPGPMFRFSAYLGTLLGQDSPSHSVLYAFTAMVSIFLPGLLLMAGILPIWGHVSKQAGRAIAGVNAVVVGLLAATLYEPIFTTAVTNLFDLLIGIVALAMLSFRHSSALLVVLWCVLANLVIHILI